MKTPKMYITVWMKAKKLNPIKNISNKKTNTSKDIIFPPKPDNLVDLFPIVVRLLKKFSQSWPKHEKPEKWIVKKNTSSEKINYKFKK